MPSEAKFSPAFQEVSPATVPLHSFCQIRFPIRIVSDRERLGPAAEVVEKAGRARKSTKTQAGAMGIARRRPALDGTSLSVSVPVLATPEPTIVTASACFLLMNRLLICIAALLVANSGLAQQKTELKDLKDKVSYSIGLDIGNTFKKQKMDLNPDALMAGLKDALSGNKPLLTEDQVKETMTTFSKEMTEKQAAANKEAATKNAADGEKFLAENKKKEGVKTTASGLQYKVVKEGSGASPKETDTVITNYRGTLLDGTEFDSSYKRNEPATFPVNRVIKGWTEALQIMKPGAKYQLLFQLTLPTGNAAPVEKSGRTRP